MHWTHRAVGCGLAVALFAVLGPSPLSAAEHSVALAPGESVEISTAAGTFGYTLELISPTVQMMDSVSFDLVPYYFVLLTNNAAVPDSFYLDIQNLTQPSWFPQVCRDQICFPFNATMGFGAGEADTIGAQVVPNSEDFGEWDFLVNSVGDPGLNDTIHMQLYVGAAATGAPRTVGAGAFELRQNVPNPLRGQTAISFVLPRQERVALTVLDVAGRLVTTLESGVLAAGPHTVAWDGRSGRGEPVPAGVYFYRLRTATGEISRSMTLIR